MAGEGALRILILNGDLPVFPGWAGHEYLHTTRLARLAGRVGLVSMVHTSEQLEKTKVLADAGVDLYLWRNPLLNQSAPGLARRAATILYRVLRSRPGRPWDTLIQDMQFCNLSGPLLEALARESWQALVVVQTHGAHWWDALPPLPLRVLVMHDVRALLYERRARAETGLKRLVYRLEAWRYRHFEARYARRYDLVVTVSPADEAWVRRHYGLEHVVTIPIPVDTDYFAPSLEAEEAARIVFTGMMNHPPNVDAACFFADVVFPRVRAAVPEAEFWVVGRNPTPRVQELARRPGIVVTGAVPDIRPYIARATVIVVPLRFGSGMRNKILEAWAMNKCVVATSVGAEGLEYQDGVDILIADDPREMAARIVQVLQDPALRDRIRRQGRARVLHQHNPERLARRYYEALTARWRAKGAAAEPMRVLIDLRWMKPGVAGGIEQIARSFLEQILRWDFYNSYTVLVPSEVRYDFDTRLHPNIHIVATDAPTRYGRLAFRLGRRWLLARLGLPDTHPPEVENLRWLHRLDAQIALSIPGYIYPDLYPLANVLIVPDLQHEYHPEFFSPHHVQERRLLYTRSIRHARHICAISEFTRQTLIERLGIPAERVTTTYLAARPAFHPDSPYRHRPDRVLTRYGLSPGSYLFYPAHTWPHKNHRVLVEALAVLREAYRLEPLLVCTGQAKEAHAEFLESVRRFRLERQVRWLGYCPEADMPGLYEGAAALVFPSLFEGFGMPVLEAMHCDCPVVCSRRTSLPEVAGEAALYVEDPRSAEAWADAIARVLTDTSLRRALVERGRRQAARFSWERFTRTVLGVLYRVHQELYGIGREVCGYDR